MKKTPNCIGKSRGNVMMESAVPDHLKMLRTRDRQMTDDHVPLYPGYVARHRPAVERVVMAYFGVQIQGPLSNIRDTLSELDATFAETGGPKHWDRAQYVDEAGFTTIISIAYWNQPDVFDAWFNRCGRSWAGEARANRGEGFFIEVVRPSVKRHETLFASADHPEGIAVLAEEMSSPVQEHGYWGSVRDRLPLSQTDAMISNGQPRLIEEGRALRVIVNDNLCLIRSGQDWIDMEAEERKVYVEDVEPVLRAGMDFLRDQGLSCGCFANRYMNVIETSGTPTAKSFGMSWWRSLGDLETWSKSHPTHVAIFGSALRYLSKFGPAARLKLYHEVTVASADEQFFLYLNCHPRTGLLRAV
jgi:aldoxime dehydratase